MTPIGNETRVRLSHSQVPMKHPDRSPWALLAPVPVGRGCFYLQEHVRTPNMMARTVSFGMTS